MANVTTAPTARLEQKTAARTEDAVKIYGKGQTEVRALDGVTIEFGAVPAAAATAWRAGDGELAGRLLLGGTGAWALSKVVKQAVRRPRPAALLPGARGRGRDAAGLGYLSGHAAVAVALGVAALPRLGPAARALTLTAMPLVGLTRVYVGAHLPLDIAGGVALGLAADAAAGLALARTRCAPGRKARAGR